MDKILETIDVNDAKLSKDNFKTLIKLIESEASNAIISAVFD